jgi:hypothetical protein
LSGPTPSAVWLAIRSDCPLCFWSELCAARRLPSRDATWFGLVASTAASSSSSWRVLGRDWRGQQIIRFLKPVLRTDEEFKISCTYCCNNQKYRKKEIFLWFFCGFYYIDLNAGERKA